MKRADCLGTGKERLRGKDSSGSRKIYKSGGAFPMHAYVNNLLITEHPGFRLQTRNWGLLL